MQTHIVHHAQPCAIDDVLMERIRHLAMPVDQEGLAIRVGVEGPDGQLYRVIETPSVVEAVQVFEVLSDLGLVPRERKRAHGDASHMRVYHAP
jgi:hypothetical protein